MLDKANCCLSVFLWHFQLQRDYSKHSAPITSVQRLHLATKATRGLFRSRRFLCLAFSPALESSISGVNQYNCSSKPTTSSSAVPVSHTIFLSICLHRSLRSLLASRRSQTWSNINQYFCRAVLMSRAQRVSFFFFFYIESEPGDISEKFLGMEWKLLMGNGF